VVRGSRCATHRPVGLVCRATWRPVLLAPRLQPPRSCLCRSQASREPHGASASRPWQHSRPSRPHSGRTGSLERIRPDERQLPLRVREEKYAERWPAPLHLVELWLWDSVPGGPPPPLRDENVSAQRPRSPGRWHHTRRGLWFAHRRAQRWDRCHDLLTRGDYGQVRLRPFRQWARAGLRLPQIASRRRRTHWRSRSRRPLSRVKRSDIVREARITDGRSAASSRSASRPAELSRERRSPAVRY
jgi:hypothetical protein